MKCLQEDRARHSSSNFSTSRALVLLQSVFLSSIHEAQLTQNVCGLYSPEKETEPQSGWVSLVLAVLGTCELAQT